MGTRCRAAGAGEVESSEKGQCLVEAVVRLHRETITAAGDPAAGRSRPTCAVGSLQVTTSSSRIPQGGRPAASPTGIQQGRLRHPFLVGRGSLQARLQGAPPGPTPDHVASRKNNITMPIVAEHFECVIGVSTHAATHTLAVVTASGAERARATFPTDVGCSRRHWAHIGHKTRAVVFARPRFP